MKTCASGVKERRLDTEMSNMNSRGTSTYLRQRLTLVWRQTKVTLSDLLACHFGEIQNNHHSA
jgi:hypothetical protein